MTETPTYAVGDTANGHILTEQGWVPIPPPPGGAPIKKKGLNIQKLGLGLFAVIFAVGLLTGVASDPSSSTTPDSDPVSVVQEEKPAAQEEMPVQETPAKEEAPEITRAQENALRSAESYLEFSGFSKAGLIRQLTSEAEGYKKADAEWAVAQLEVDWKEQAVRSGESYLEFSSFSRDGLIRQLSSEAEGFTKAEAVYAVDQLGL